MSLYDDVRAILAAPEWEPVTVTNHGAFVTIAGRFNGVAHAGSRADWASLARDLDRIARERHEAAKKAALEEAAPAAEPAPAEPDPRDAELAALRARIAELESASYIDRDERPDAVEAEPEIEPTRKMIPEQIGALMQEGETFEEARDRLTPELNRELAKLKNARGLAGEDLEREAEIETLLGMLSRLGEG